jgi:hypothetical protein
MSRLSFVEPLCKAVAGAGTFVYNQTFEYPRLDDLSEWLPAHTSDFEAIKAGMWDLFVVVRRNVYHPAFARSFSLKSELPAVVPEKTYETLEVAEGTAAGLAWAHCFFIAMQSIARPTISSAVILNFLIR